MILVVLGWVVGWVVGLGVVVLLGIGTFIGARNKAIKDALLSQPVTEESSKALKDREEMVSEELTRSKELAWEAVLQEEWATAVSHYTAAIRIKPDYAMAYYSRGLAYIHLEEYDKAIADYTEAIRIDSDFADAYNNRGVAHRKLGDDVKAAADFAKAKKLGYKP